MEKVNEVCKDLVAFVAKRDGKGKALQFIVEYIQPFQKSLKTSASNESRSVSDHEVKEVKRKCEFIGYGYCKSSKCQYLNRKDILCWTDI
jgi:hypothetical protein